MRVLISAEGTHDPAGHHLMAVDGHQFLIDLSQIQGGLVDPGILRVEWGPTVLVTEVRDGGQITRRDGSKQAFWDKAAIEPYLTAWRARRDELKRREDVLFAETKLVGDTKAFVVLPDKDTKDTPAI